MNLQDTIAGVVLLSFAVNAGDRLLTRRGRLLSFPRPGSIWYFFAALSILLSALAALSLLRAVPVVCFLVAGAASMFCSQACAIFSRHRPPASCVSQEQ